MSDEPDQTEPPRRSQAERALGHDPKAAPWIAWGSGAHARANESPTDEVDALPPEAALPPESPAPAEPQPVAAAEPDVVAEPVVAAEATDPAAESEPVVVPESDPPMDPVPPVEDAVEPPAGDSPSRAARARLAGAAVLLIGAIIVGIVTLVGGGDDEPAPLASTPATTTSTSPQDASVAQPKELDAKTAEDQLGDGHIALKVTSRQLLRTRPAADGQLVAKVGRKTPYGGAVVLPILKAKGDWVAVVSPYRKNNRVAWTKVGPKAKFVAVEYSIAVRVRDRSIIVRKNGKVVRRMKAAVGQVTHPTPPGRYAITDGLIFAQKIRGPYGCCALVLSARQTKLPSGWTGGDRIAIHGTPNKDSIGLAASLGCLRVGDEASRWLVKTVPAGATVFVRS